MTRLMAEATDYYRTLEVDERASGDAIKLAYRRLALAHHPDRNPGDTRAEEAFKQVREAYEVLSDDLRRRAYDRARRNPFAQTHPGGTAFDGLVRPPGGAPAPGLDPLLSFFYHDEPARADARSLDVEAQVQLTFDQALRGGKTEVSLPDGEPLRLSIPRGIRSGVRMRVKGRGRRSAHGADGDLLVTFRVEPSTRFRREGDHLHIAETVSAIEAILGTTRQITNAYGQTVKVFIPPGTQPGERLRLRGQGVVTDKLAGDLFVEVQVTVPRQLTDAQRAELEAAALRAGIL